MPTNSRIEERIPATLPVMLRQPQQAEGLTRDVSVSGIFIKTDCSFAAGNDISFSIEIQGQTGILHLNCKGTVVRMESSDKGMGVAVKITESTLMPAE